MRWFVGLGFVFLAGASTLVTLLAQRDLDTADKVASVVSGSVAVLALVVAVFAALRPDQRRASVPDKRKLVVMGVAAVAALAGPPIVLGVVHDPATTVAEQDPVVTWVPARTLVGAKDTIHSLEFSPTGALVAAGDWAGEVHVWDARSGDLVRVLPSEPNANISGVTFSPDGSLLAVAGVDNEVIVYDTDDWSKESTIKGSAAVAELAISQDGESIAILDFDGNLRVRGTRSGERIGSLKDVRWVAFEDADTLAISDQSTIRRWDVDDKEFTTTLLDDNALVGPFWLSPDHRLVALGGAGKDRSRIREVSSGTEVTLESQPESTDAMAFTADGQFIAMETKATSVTVWNTSTRKAVTTLNGPRSNIRVLAYSSTGALAAAGDDHLVTLWQQTTR